MKKTENFKTELAILMKKYNVKLVVESLDPEASLTFDPGTVYTITVGAGGAGVATTSIGNNGVDSSISGTGISASPTVGRSSLTLEVESAPSLAPPENGSN